MPKGVAFCPWIRFKVKPFDCAGIRVAGFREVEPTLTSRDRKLLWAVRRPYRGAALSKNFVPRHWNDNPLLYVVDPSDLIRFPTPPESHQIAMVNAYLYVCVAANNPIAPADATHYTNSSD